MGRQTVGRGVSSPRDPVRKDVETGAPSRRWTCQGHTVSSSRIRPDSGPPAPVPEQVHLGSQPPSLCKLLSSHPTADSGTDAPRIPSGTGGWQLVTWRAQPLQVPSTPAAPRSGQNPGTPSTIQKKKNENNLMLPNAALIISPSNKICLQT